MAATAERVGKVARIGWWWGVWVIRAMPELKSFFRCDCFPKFQPLTGWGAHIGGGHQTKAEDGDLRCNQVSSPLNSSILDFDNFLCHF